MFASECPTERNKQVEIMGNTMCRGTRAFSDELSGSRSGGPLREPAGENKKDRERERLRGRGGKRKISRRYSLERRSVEKRYAVLEFRPFCCARGGRLV